MTRKSQCPPEHKHGQTPTCYRTHLCACTPCRQANAKRHYEYIKLIAYGRPTSNLIDATRTQRRVGRLIAEGWTPSLIAAEAGVSASAIDRLARAERTGTRIAKVFSETSERIMALTINEPRWSKGSKISPRGALRRIEALMTLGWSERELSRRLDDKTLINRIRRQTFIAFSTHQKISALYELLWDKPAETDPAVRAHCAAAVRKRARKRGYLPPLAWDDIDTDDEAPSVEADNQLVDELAVTLALAGEIVQLRRQEIDEVIRRGTQADLSAAQIAARVPRTSRTIERARGHQRASAA